MAACLFPYHVEAKRPLRYEDKYIPVPCGRCPECLKRRSMQWTFRIAKEAENCISALFVTLTYNTSTVPITKNGFMTLDKEHVKTLMHKLRSYHAEKNLPKLRYYICGEYGGNRQRPHYHAIILNCNVQAILDRWPYGSVHIGKTQDASIAYTVGYLNKGKIVPAHKNDDRQPEFSHMSKGLGKGYITEPMIKFHWQSPEHLFLTLPDGVKISLPRYYRDKIFPKDTFEGDLMRKQQADFMKKKIAELEKQNTQTFEEKNASRLNSIDIYRRQQQQKRTKDGQ